MFLLFLPWWRLHEGQSLVCCKTRSLRSSARGPTALFTWCYQQLIQCLVLWLSWMARCSGSALIIPSTPCCAPEEEPIPPSLWRGMNLRDMVLLLFIPLCLPDVGRGKLRRDPWCAFLGGVGLSTSPASSHCNISEGERVCPGQSGYLRKRCQEMGLRQKGLILEPAGPDSLPFLEMR